MKKTKIMLASSLLVILTTSLVAQFKSTDEMLKTMKKEDITYAQLMAGMQMASNNIQSGIISMNKVLVDRGINFIRTHPAPRKKPWVIMKKEDQEAFKSTLLVYDKQMDDDVLAIEKALNKKDWAKAMDASQELNNTCLSCHLSWKNNVKYIMD